LYLLHVSTFHRIDVDIVEGSDAAIEEQAIHQVHECKEAIVPKFGNERTLNL
jgi:hypothetical protein